MTRHTHCANCKCFLDPGMTTGVSGLYNPGPNSFLLCEDCWLTEEAVVEADGTNVQPKMVAHYKANQPEGAN